MDMFGTISTQIDAMNLPLFAVTLTAVPRRRTPVLLMLHWHAFRSADASSVRAARRGLRPSAIGPRHEKSPARGRARWESENADVQALAANFGSR